MISEKQRARRIAIVLATMSAITVISLTFGFIHWDKVRESRAAANRCEKQMESVQKLAEEIARQNEILSDQLSVLQRQGNPK